MRPEVQNRPFPDSSGSLTSTEQSETVPGVPNPLRGSGFPPQCRDASIQPEEKALVDLFCLVLKLGRKETTSHPHPLLDAHSAGRQQRLEVGTLNMRPCLLLSLPPRSRNHSPRTLLPLRQRWVPGWLFSQTVSADPTLLAQGQEGQRGTPGVHLLPVFPASCFPQTNKLLRVEEVDRSGTQSRKLGARSPSIRTATMEG